MKRDARSVRGLAALVSFTILWSAPVFADPDTDVSMTTRVRDRLDDYLQQRASSRVNRVEIPNLDSFALAGVDPLSVDIALRTRATGELLGRVPITVILSSGSEELKRGIVSVDLKVYSDVYVASRSLSRGQVIGDDDFRRARRNLATFRGPVITRESELRGMRLRRSISAGRVWQPQFLETVPTVKRGELVRLRLESGSLRIDGRGKASEDGGVGDWIRVLNSASNRFVTGQVDAEGNVHVRF